MYCFVLSERASFQGDRYEVHNWSDSSCVKATECRPRLVGVIDTDSALVSDLLITDAAYWTVHVRNSTNVELMRLHIHGDDLMPNNDGVDIDSSRSVLLHDVHVITADDAVCVKTTLQGRPAQHIMVRHCTLGSRSSAVKLGSESVADMHNITFVDITVRYIMNLSVWVWGLGGDGVAGPIPSSYFPLVCTSPPRHALCTH